MRAVWAEPLGGAVEGWVNLVCLDEEVQQTMQWFLSPDGLLFESIEDQIPPFVRPFAEPGLAEKIEALGDDQTITLWLDFIIDEPVLPSLDFYGALPGAGISSSAATTSDAPVVNTYYIDGVEVSEEEFLWWQQAYISAQRLQSEERDQLVRAQAVTSLSILVDSNSWHDWLNVDAIAEGQLERPGWVFASTLILDIDGMRARQLLQTGESLAHISEYVEASTDGDQSDITSHSATSETTNTMLLLDGNRITWPEDGWYQVQSILDYSSICEGGSSCSVPPGDYIVINHTTGVRNSISVLGNVLEGSNPTLQITVSGNRITWPDDGWYQVQTQENYSSVCEGGRFCEVSPGAYIVINHSTGVRSEITVQGQTNLPAPSAVGISVTDGILSWPDDGWYQVQTRDGYIPVCEGGRSCLLPVGEYVVINHTTQVRTPVTIDSSSLFSAPRPGTPLDEVPIVQGLQISWLNGGWYQVQFQSTLQSVCEGGSGCTVEPGIYIVINHSTGRRWENIVVPSATAVSATPTNVFDDDDGDGTINFQDVDFTGGLDANFDGIDDRFQPLTDPNGS